MHLAPCELAEPAEVPLTYRDSTGTARARSCAIPSFWSFVLLLRAPAHATQWPVHKNLTDGVRFLRCSFSYSLLECDRYTIDMVDTRSPPCQASHPPQSLYDLPFIKAVQFTLQRRPVIQLSHENAFATFIPVNKGPKGYESFYGQNNRHFPQGGCLCSELYPVGWDGNRYLENWPSELQEDHIVKGWVWVELEQAVRRLTGEPS